MFVACADQLQCVKCRAGVKMSDVARKCHDDNSREYDIETTFVQILIYHSLRSYLRDQLIFYSQRLPLRLLAIFASINIIPLTTRCQQILQYLERRKRTGTGKT